MADVVRYRSEPVCLFAQVLEFVYSFSEVLGPPPFLMWMWPGLWNHRFGHVA